MIASGKQRPRILILGGTGLARKLANRLVALEAYDVETSLVGATENPALPNGSIRTGGFGGADGLSTYLQDQRFELLIDATHSFAARITKNAAIAADQVGVPRLVLAPEPWRAGPGDDWHRVFSQEEAVSRASALGRCLFVTLGARALSAFAILTQHKLVARMITPPDPHPDHPDLTVVLERGPFDLISERALLSEYGIEVVVAKNSGGGDTSPKLVAARELGLPVVLMDRPAVPDSERVASIDQAVAWIRSNTV